MTTGATMNTHEYGYVTGTYLLPDRTPATRLRVLLTPVRVRLDDPPATLLRTATTCYVDSSGLIMKVDTDEHPVPLVPGLYEVTFAGMTNPSVPLPFIVEVTAAHTEQAPLDLPIATPIPAPGPMAEIVRGASAYEIAVANGFVGTELEWLASLVGGGEGGGGVVSYSQITGLPDYPQVFPADFSGLTPASIGAQPAGAYLTLADLPEFPEIPEIPEIPDFPDLSGFVHTDDERLSDAREPTPHRHPWTDLDDVPAIPATPQDIGAQPAGEYLTADDLPEAPDLSGYVRTVNGTGPDEDGDVTVEGGGGGANVQPHLWVHHSSNTSASNNSTASFDAVAANEGGFVSGSSNRWRIPPGSQGLWLVEWAVRLSSGSNSYAVVEVGGQEATGGSIIGSLGHTGSTVLRLPPDAQVSIRYWYTGSNVNLTGNATPTHPWASYMKLTRLSD